MYVTRAQQVVRGWGAQREEAVDGPAPRDGEIGLVDGSVLTDSLCQTARFDGHRHRLTLLASPRV
jgi:hypothetical protein